MYTELYLFYDDFGMELVCVSIMYSNIGKAIVFNCKRIHLDHLRPQVRAFEPVLLNA